jgi:hypothetical protein
MSESGLAPVNGVWKWISGILIAIMLAGLPGVVQTFRAPSRAQIEAIQERQNMVLQRLAVLEVQMAINQALIKELQAELREHEEGGG